MTALLYSGGLDSACAWWLLGKPLALHFGGGKGPARDASDGEAWAIAEQCRICPEFAKALRSETIDFTPFMRRDEWVFPRDQICCIAAWALGCGSVSIAWCRDDGTPADWARTQKARYEGAVGADGFTVSFPMLLTTKREMVRRALTLGAPPAFLLATHSCVRASTPCGECHNCKQRAEALAGVA